MQSLSLTYSLTWLLPYDTYYSHRICLIPFSAYYLAGFSSFDECDVNFDVPFVSADMFPTCLLRSSTVNASEIAHFSRLSSEWWNERGEFSFLHKMNPIRMQFIREKLIETAYDEQPETVNARKVRILEGMDVLDVGCGGGLLSEVSCLVSSS